MSESDMFAILAEIEKVAAYTAEQARDMLHREGYLTETGEVAEPYALSAEQAHS